MSSSTTGAKENGNEDKSNSDHDELESTPWAEITDQIRDIELEQVLLAQAFGEGDAHLAVTYEMENSRETFLVTSNRSMVQLGDDAVEIDGRSLAIRGNRAEYSRLVHPRWRKESLEAFLRGEASADAKGVFRRLRDALNSLIEFPTSPTDPDVVTLWVIGTYLYRLFDAYPYLGVIGPMGSGKTKLATFLDEVVFNPLRTDSITKAQLFRSTETTGGVLILDEQDSLEGYKADAETLQLLRGGYKNGGKAIRSRDTGDGWRTEEFDTYSPKVLITTSGFDSFLAARCITVHMLRSTGKQGKALVKDVQEDLRAIRDDLYRLALESFEDISRVYRDPDFAPKLNARQRERWLPLLAVATLVCPDNLDELAATAIADADSDTILADPTDTAFLRALDELVKEQTVRLTTSELRLHMGRALGFADTDVNASAVGRLVRKYLGNIGRRSGKNGKTEYIVARARVDDLLERYPLPAYLDEGTERTEEG